MLIFKLPFHLIIFNLLVALLDISVISFLFYKIYQILSQTKAVQVLKGITFFIILYLLSKLLQLETFSWILNQIANVIVIAIIIIFQPELRRVLTKIGQPDWLTHFTKRDPKNVNKIIKAIQNFSLLQIGALIVFERKVGLKNIIESGTILNAQISTSLLLSIFNNKSPLHDGAVVIRNDTIVAAGCFLPLSESPIIKKEFGTRHRAAVGITEETDAVAVVVSEETGMVSLSYDGKLFTNYEINDLEIKLLDLLGYKENGNFIGFINEEN